MPIKHEDQEYFSQDEVNGFNKAERLKREEAETSLTTSKEEKDTLLGQISTLKETAKLTDEQKAQHETEIEEIRQKGLTEAQRQEETILTLKKNLKETEVKAEQSTSEWKTRHHAELVGNAIASSLGLSDNHTAVINPEPVVALLSPKVTVQEKDGKFIPVVKGHEVKDEDGNITYEDVTIETAVAAMYASEAYKYLFQEKGKTGAGGGQGEGGSGDADMADPNNPPADPKRLKAWRTKHGIGNRT